MSHGIRITNPSGQLVISSEGRGLHCIGKATLQGSIVQATGSPTAASPGRLAGHSTYRISHAGQIIPAVALPTGKRVGILSITSPSSGTWDIKVYCGDTPDSNGFDTVQYEAEVWAFGLPLAPPSGWGGAIYDASHNIAYDLTKPYPLFPLAFVSYPSDLTSVTIPSLTKHVAMGVPTSTEVLVNHPSFNTWEPFEQRAMLLRTTGTSAKCSWATMKRYRVFGPEMPDVLQSDVYETPSFLIEGAALP